MRRSCVARTFASVFAVWFAMTLAEPAALHACPMHGATAAGHAHDAVARGAADHHADMHGRVMHHASALGETGSTGASGHQHAARYCTCMGACAVSSASAALPASVDIMQRVVIYATRSPRLTLRAHAIGPRPFFLPWSNGPPALAAIA